MRLPLAVGFRSVSLSRQRPEILDHFRVGKESGQLIGQDRAPVLDPGHTRSRGLLRRLRRLTICVSQRGIFGRDIHDQRMSGQGVLAERRSTADAHDPAIEPPRWSSGRRRILSRRRARCPTLKSSRWAPLTAQTKMSGRLIRPEADAQRSRACLIFFSWTRSEPSPT